MDDEKSLFIKMVRLEKYPQSIDIVFTLVVNSGRSSGFSNIISHGICKPKINS